MELIDTPLTVSGLRLRPAAAVLAVGLFVFGAEAAEGADASGAICPTDGAEPLELGSVVTGDLFLSADGDEVRLAGILAPVGREIGAAQATAAITRALSGNVRSIAVGDGRDRYGRMLAHIFVDGAWLQEILLREGVVRAYPEMEAFACWRELYAAEADARTGQAGLWGGGTFTVSSPADLVSGEEAYAGTYQIAEGTVLDVAHARGRYFLNFGDDYRTDFTVTVAPGDMRNFRAADYDLEELEGRRVRVRGWLESYNGPNMPISDPSAIELLD